MNQRMQFAVVLSLLLGMTLYWGCSRKETTISNGKHDSTHGSNTQPPLKPILTGWETPALVLFLSGEMHGYLEPCGCSETQSGGLAQRADLFRLIQEEKKWPILGLDLGGLANRDRASRMQSRLKFSATLAALKELNCTSIGLGTEEILLERSEPYFLLGQQTPEPDKPESGPVFVSANMQIYEEPGLSLPVRFQIRDIAGKKVAVTSILGKSQWKNLFPQGVETSMKWQSPSEAMKEVIPQMQSASPDITVLLSHANETETEQLAQETGYFDIVVSLGREEPGIEVKQIEKSMVVTLGHKGKHIGVLGYYPDAAENKFRYEIIELDGRRFHPMQNMINQMQSYQNAIQSVNLAETEPPIPHPNTTGSTFVGAETCKNCHTKAYGKWSTTKHAKAFESLHIGREGEEEHWVSRTQDPECLACHVTGWSPKQALRFDTGYLSKEKTPHLVGQQCENCHGPGSEHVKQEVIWKEDRSKVSQVLITKLRGDMRLSKDLARQNVCITCHDAENSPKFKDEFEKYWEEVHHPWRD